MQLNAKNMDSWIQHFIYFFQVFFTFLQLFIKQYEVPNVLLKSNDDPVCLLCGPYLCYTTNTQPVSAHIVQPSRLMGYLT